MRGTGTIVNVLAVLLGGTLGLFLKKGLEERYQQILMQALGLATIFIGVSGTLQRMFQITDNSLESGGTMLIIFSLVLGSILGEWIDLEDKMEIFGEWLKNKCGGKNDSQFVEGFVAASLTICIGAMAIVGALQDGMTGDASMLYAKAVLDGVILVVFASAYGKGAIFSALPVGIWQGGITLFAKALEPFFTDQIISDLSLVGNMLIFCVGVNLAFGKKFRVANMLPALIFVVIYDGIAMLL
jgi:hypothetical protein